MKRHLVVMILLGLSASGFAQGGGARKNDTGCTGFPCVVATVALSNQSASATEVPIYTPPSGGVFRISAYLNTSTGTVQRAYWRVDFGWTDEGGTRSGATITQFVASGQNGFDSTTIVASDLAGAPLTYTALPHGGGGGVGGMTYSLLITVEQLE